MKLALDITEWLNDFTSKKGKLGTLVICKGKNTSGAPFTLKIGDKTEEIAVDAPFSCVSWSSNSNFTPDTRTATIETDDSRVSLGKLTKLEWVEAKETVKAKVTSTVEGNMSVTCEC